MHSVGFEPTHPKILRPERSALDPSATNANLLIVKTYLLTTGIEPATVGLLDQCSTD